MVIFWIKIIKKRVKKIKFIIILDGLHGVNGSPISTSTPADTSLTPSNPTPDPSHPSHTATPNDAQQPSIDAQQPSIDAQQPSIDAIFLGIFFVVVNIDPCFIFI